MSPAHPENHASRILCSHPQSHRTPGTTEGHSGDRCPAVPALPHAGVPRATPCARDAFTRVPVALPLVVRPTSGTGDRLPREGDLPHRAGTGGSLSSVWVSYLVSEQFFSPSLAVGLPRYQHHPSPVCDRKDFVLNFNGISSFHPSASGSYYHHHHHQSVCQDIKPCVM